MPAIEPYVRRAQFHETDQMAIVHHSNYIKWFEEARVHFMEQIGYGYERATLQGVDFAVLSVECEYKAMVRFHDDVAIHCCISELTPSRMAVSYRVLSADGKTLHATGTSRHCYYHNAKQRPVSLKKAIPELYAILEQHYTPQL